MERNAYKEKLTSPGDEVDVERAREEYEKNTYSISSKNFHYNNDDA